MECICRSKEHGQAYDQTRNSIWLVSNTGELRSLEPIPGQGRTPAWSPDGQWLACESNRASPNQLYAVFIINQNGTGLRRVAPYELDANHPVWSPDAKHLVFSARHAKGKEATGIAIIGCCKALMSREGLASRALRPTSARDAPSHFGDCDAWITAHSELLLNPPSSEMITEILGLQSWSGPPHRRGRQHYGYLS